MNGSAELRLQAGVTTASAAETQAVAAAWARELPEGDITLALHGDLGAGKTTFVQGLARGWDIADHVTSPTFTIYNIHRGTRLLIHLDAYRLKAPAQLDELMLPDFLTSPYCLAVEWPENVAGWLPEGTKHLHFALLPDGKHYLKL